MNLNALREAAGRAVPWLLSGWLALFNLSMCAYTSWRDDQPWPWVFGLLMLITVPGAYVSARRMEREAAAGAGGEG